MSFLSQSYPLLNLSVAVQGLTLPLSLPTHTTKRCLFPPLNMPTQGVKAVMIFTSISLHITVPGELKCQFPTYIHTYTGSYYEYSEPILATELD